MDQVDADTKAQNNLGDALFFKNCSFQGQKLVVYKLEFDAKSRGRNVHIEFYKKVISHKSKKTSILNSIEK